MEPSTAETVARPSRRSSSFAGDVLKLVTGTVSGQVLSVLASPILTRLYGPDAYGAYALFVSITSVIGVVICLRYELAILLPEKDEEAASVLGLSISLAALISSLLVPLLWYGRPFIVRWLNAPELGPYLWLVPPAVLVSGVLLALSYWNSRARRFGRLSIAQAGSSFVTVGTQLGSGLTGRATGGSLVSANVAGSAVATTVLGVQIWREEGPLLRRSLRGRSVLRELVRYRKFPLYDTWSALLNSISWQLPALMLSASFSSAVVGYYGLSNRVLHLPMNLVGKAIGQVFFQRAAEAKSSGTLPVVVEGAFQRLVALGMFPMLTLMVTGPDIFTVIFGHSWAEAGVYTQILALWTFVWFASSPLHTLFSVLERQEISFAWNVVNLGTRFLSLWIGGRLNDSRLALLLFGASGIVVYGYYCLAILSVVGVPWNRVARILLRYLALFAPAGLLLIGLVALGVPPPVRVLASGALLMGFYAYVLKTDPELHALLRGALERRKAVD